MQPLQWERRPDGLRAPALVCAFKGWNDAGDAASAALTFVGSALSAQRFAVIDPEDFYDFPQWAREYMDRVESALGDAYSEPAADVRGFVAQAKGG